MSCCDFRSNGQSGGGVLPPLFEQSNLVDSFDLREQGTVDFNAAATTVQTMVSEGGVSLDMTATRQTTFAGSSFGLVSGTGLQFIPNTQSTVFTSVVGTRTAASMMFRALDFWNAFGVDGRRDYFMAVYCSVLTLPTAQVSPSGFHWGLLGRVNIPGGSSDRYIAIRRHNAAGAQALGTLRDGAANGNYTSPIPTADTKAFGFQWAAAFDCFAGDWDMAGGQSWEDVEFTREAASLIMTTTGGAQYKDRGNDVVMAFPTGNALADVRITVERVAMFSPL